MKRSLCLLGSLLVLGVSGPVAAEELPVPPTRVMTFGVEGAVVLPLSDYGDVATLGLGVLGSLELPVGPQLTATGRAGLIYHLLEGNIDGTLIFIPLLGGLKYQFDPFPGGAYVAGELGLNVGYGRVRTPFGTASDTDTELALSLGGGFQFDRVDLRGALFFPSLDDLGDAFGILITVGYRMR